VSWLVRAIYYFADSLLIQSRAFHEPVAHFASDNKIVYYPNSIDSPLNIKNNLETIPRDLISLMQSKFCVVFAGNVGEAQSVETIVQAALKLKDHSEIKVVIIGSGSRLDWMHKQQEELNLDNLYLAGRFSMSVMPELYRYASGLLVTLKSEAIFSLTVPSKVQAYLAAGKPIIAALNGEGARIVEESGAGLTCLAEDAEALANSIKRLYEMDDASRREMGDRGRAYFNEHFEMKRQTQQLIEILEQRITVKKRGR
jgi:glycosyltransferase involved in cell wall biosynthesis